MHTEKDSDEIGDETYFALRVERVRYGGGLEPARRNYKGSLGALTSLTSLLNSK
jgi:hypothetical protein